MSNLSYNFNNCDVFLTVQMQATSTWCSEWQKSSPGSSNHHFHQLPYFPCLFAAVRKTKINSNSENKSKKQWVKCMKMRMMVAHIHGCCGSSIVVHPCSFKWNLVRGIRHYKGSGWHLQYGLWQLFRQVWHSRPDRSGNIGATNWTTLGLLCVLGNSILSQPSVHCVQ